MVFTSGEIKSNKYQLFQAVLERMSEDLFIITNCFAVLVQLAIFILHICMYNGFHTAPFYHVYCLEKVSTKRQPIKKLKQTNIYRMKIIPLVLDE